MPKVAKKEISNHTFLDKLAQLSPSHGSPHGNACIQAFAKRAKAKHFTLSYLRHLIDLDGPLKKSYTNTLFCCSTLHQKGNKITSKYCNNRWCIVCNRIRIAKSINGYMPELQKLVDPQFVTLTIPNVNIADLRGAIAEMILTWRRMYQATNKHTKGLRGVRKLECTYNPVEDSYHPHFHMIVEGRANGERILDDWLTRHPGAVRKAQDIRPADTGSMMELFKYFTKIITKQHLYIPPMDVIFQAMQNRRVFQPYGIKKISEEVEDLQSETVEGIIERESFWEWLNHDWVETETGEHLTGYLPSDRINALIAQGLVV